MSFINDHKKPRRDRIAREAEEAAARVARSIERGRENTAYNADAIGMIVQGTRRFFARREGWNYPHTNALQDVLDVVRLEFYRSQKELGIGGQAEGSTDTPDDPQFGQRGRYAITSDEWAELVAFREGHGPRPWFIMDDGDPDKRTPG